MVDVDDGGAAAYEALQACLDATALSDDEKRAIMEKAIAFSRHAFVDGMRTALPIVAEACTIVADNIEQAGSNPTGQLLRQLPDGIQRCIDSATTALLSRMNSTS